MQGEEMTDAELIEMAMRIAENILNYEICHEADVDSAIVNKIADRLAALTTPEPWRSVSELPAILERVFVRVGEDRTEVGYRTRGFACGWADDEGRCLPGVTGWQPIIRPAP